MDPEDYTCSKLHVTCEALRDRLVLQARIKELEETLRDALGSFKGTQCVAHYPKLHWSRRACELLGEPTIQPGYIAFTRS